MADRYLCQRDVFIFLPDAFPRCSFLLHRFHLNTDCSFLQVRVLHEEGYVVKTDDFAVKESTAIRFYGLRLFKCVNVCILQSGVDGCLSKKDTDILRYYKHWHSTEDVIFVMNGDISDKQYHKVSKQIEEELDLRREFNDILHRLFPRSIDGIAIRISLLLEKQLIAFIVPLLGRRKAKKQNQHDLQYHQLKCISLRNELICEFGYENSTLFVSIEKPEQSFEVQKYLDGFLHNADKIKVKEFTKMEIENLALKSGDRVYINHVHGTVGVFLTTGDMLFCTTCWHVVADATDNVMTRGNHPFQKGVTISNMPLHTDRIFTPLRDLDFSAIRLASHRIPIELGLKNQFARNVDGIMFAADMLLPHDSHVYKWGGKSGLTNGTFKCIRETRNQPAEVEIESDGVNYFASPGDSGALICYNEDGQDFAAFVLKGVSRSNRSVAVGYKLADAINECERIFPNIKAGIVTTEPKVSIF